jgi:hypothetical protein
MISHKTWAILHRVYDDAHTALWAVLFASVVMILAFVVPHLPEARATAARQQAAELSAESKFYCEKWGMRPGTHRYTLCTLDLQEIRAKAIQRLTDDELF